LVINNTNKKVKKTKNEIKDSIIARGGSKISDITIKSKKKVFSKENVIITIIIGIICSLIAAWIWSIK
ncbi:MAG: hypothetical protein WAM46_21585, partial [Flavobacterium sp.]